MAVPIGKTRISVTIDDNTHSALSEIGRATDRSISYIVQKAVSFYLSKNPDSFPSLDANQHKTLEACDDC